MKNLFLLLCIAFCDHLLSQCSASITPLTQSVNCTGGTVGFTNTAISPTLNVRHDWYSPNHPLPNGIPVFSSTGSISILSGSYSAGVYTVVTSDPGNQCQFSQTFTVTSNGATPTFSMMAMPDFSIGCSPSITLTIANPVSTQTPPSTLSYTFLPPGFSGSVSPFLGVNGSTVTSLAGNWTVIVQDNSNSCRAILPLPVGMSSTQPSFNYTVGGTGLVFFQSTSTGTNGGTTFNWDFGDGTTGSGMNPSHTYSNGGVHQVVLSTANPSCFTANSPVNVNTLPCTANSGYTLQYSGTPQLWYAYPNYYGNVTNAIWSWGDGSFTNALFPSHTYSAAGFYNICLSVTVSCANTSSFCSNYNIFKGSNADEMAMVTVSVIPKPPVGLRELNVLNQRIRIYPIPADRSISFSFETSVSELKKARIVNIFGQCVKEIEFNMSVEDASIDTSELPSGIYFLTFGVKPEITKRFVIVR